MKKVFRSAVILILMLPLLSFGQKDTVGWGRNSNYNRMYDPKTVVTIKGEITAVDEVAPMGGMSSGIHLLVKSGTEVVSVHVGPKWHLDKQSMKFKVNDKVVVKGSKVSMDGKPVIIAREIVNGEKLLKLRDVNGVPVWAGRRKR